MIELVGIRVGQRVLILRLLEPAADVDVLPCLHEELRADDFCDLGPQPRHDLLHRRPLVERLQLDEHAGGVFARITARRPGEAHDARHRRILQDDGGELVLDLGHRLRTKCPGAPEPCRR